MFARIRLVLFDLVFFSLLDFLSCTFLPNFGFWVSLLCADHALGVHFSQHGLLFLLSWMPGAKTAQFLSKVLWPPWKVKPFNNSNKQRRIQLLKLTFHESAQFRTTLNPNAEQSLIELVIGDPILPL
jgi:hypothetical protein